MLIDWVKVLELVLSGVITLGVSLATLLIYKWLTDRKDKKREGILYEVAVLRGKGIVLRNQGEFSELSGDEHKDWQSRVAELEKALIEKANEFSKVEGIRLDDLDRVRVLTYQQIHNTQQISTLQNLSGILERADALVNKYRY